LRFKQTLRFCSKNHRHGHGPAVARHPPVGEQSGSSDYLRKGNGDGDDAMNNWEFGFTMIVVGMGGTLVVLALFAVLMSLLKKTFPVRDEDPAE
jgi:hypothetical protein